MLPEVRALGSLSPRDACSLVILTQKTQVNQGFAGEVRK